MIFRGPQTREQVRGRDAYVRFNVEGFLYDWHLTVQRVVGEGRAQPAGSSSPGQKAPSPACASSISPTTARSP